MNTFFFSFLFSNEREHAREKRPIRFGETVVLFRSGRPTLYYNILHSQYFSEAKFANGLAAGRYRSTRDVTVTAVTLGNSYPGRGFRRPAGNCERKTTRPVLVDHRDRDRGRGTPVRVY